MTIYSALNNFIHSFSGSFIFQLIVCFFLGASAVLSFSPFQIEILIIFSLAIFFQFIYSSKNIKHAALLGLFFGIGFMGFGVSWIYISIEKFGGVSPFLAFIFTILFILFISIYFSIFGGAVKLIGRNNKKPFVMIFIIPSLWFLIELARGLFFTGFPWLSIGYSQINSTISSFAPIIGVYGVGFVIAFIAASLTLWKKIWPVLLVLSIWLISYGLSFTNWTEPMEEKINVAIVQGNIEQSKKWEPTLFFRNLQLYLDLTKNLSGSDVIVWPETAVAAFDDQIEEEILSPIQNLAAKNSFDLLTGIVNRNFRGEYYNSVINLGASGRQIYKKSHLVPFGEYLPLKPISKTIFSFLSIPMSDFSPGENKRNIKLGGNSVGVSICYEDVFSSEIAKSFPKSRYLVNVSNDAWFGDSLAPHQHLEIAQMRALEFGRFFVRSTNNGISAIIDNRGKIRKIAPQFKEFVLESELILYEGATPYSNFNDVPLIIVSFIFLLICMSNKKPFSTKGQ